MGPGARIIVNVCDEHQAFDAEPAESHTSSLNRTRRTERASSSTYATSTRPSTLGANSQIEVNSLREERVNEIRLRAHRPRMAVPVQDLEMSIAAWETDIRLFSEATGEAFLEANRRLGFLNM